MSSYAIPLVWSMYGRCYVEANSLAEAIEIAIGPDTPLPDGSYVDESVEVDYDVLKVELDAEAHKSQLSDDQVQEISTVAGTMLKACVADYDSAIWDEIASTVLDDVLECTNLQYGGGFTSDDVALALGRALLRKISDHKED